jgi:predicted alpha/beta-fold hydrolase
MGKGLNELILKHESALKDHFNDKLGIDIKKTIESTEVSILQFDQNFTAPAFGYKDRDDYYQKSSCCNKIPLIKSPSLFMNSLDDPIVGKESLTY